MVVGACPYNSGGGAYDLIFDYMDQNSMDEILRKSVVSSYKESCNNKPMYGYNIMLPNLSPSPNLYKVQSACLQ